MAWSCGIGRLSRPPGLTNVHDRGPIAFAKVESHFFARRRTGLQKLMRKIDVFTHISPPGYSEGVDRIAGGLKDIGKRTRGVPMLHDLDVRFQVMETFPGYQQVLSLPTPPIELYA